MLEKLSSESQAQQCYIKENLRIGVYLDDHWDGEFDDESLYYYNTPEYALAQAAFDLLMKPLSEAGLVEIRQGKSTAN